MKVGSILTDIVETVNGIPNVYMSLHSTNHKGGDAQHPPESPLWMNSNLNKVPIIAGLEWNKQDDIGQLDLTWWFTWYEPKSKSWKSDHSTKSLFASTADSDDYYDFWDSFDTEGFSLLINLAQGGDFPGTNDVLVDGQEQTMQISSVKVYGF